MRESKSKPEPPRANVPPPRFRVAGVAALLTVVAVLGVFVFRQRGKAAKPVAPAVSAAPSGAQLSWNMVPPADMEAPRGPRRGGGGHRHRRGYEASLERYLEATRYPPTSRPMTEAGAYRLPDAPPPATRSDDDAKGHVVEQRERQNMYYVAEGESAITMVDVTVDGKPGRDLDQTGASLSKLEGTPPVAGASIASAVFRDDGAPPDEHKGDGTITAIVPFPKEGLRDFVGDMTLSAIVKVGEASITTTFGFVYTGHPPARFTGEIREAIEDGSLAFHAQLDVQSEGDYTVRARLYDAAGDAIVFMLGDGKFGEGRHDVRFLAFGRLLRDLGAKSPFALRDLEAYIVTDKYPNRLKVPTWPGPYTTRRYGPTDFSDREWVDAEKQKRVAEMEAAIRAAPE